MHERINVRLIVYASKQNTIKKIKLNKENYKKDMYL